jgi:solute carrier family 35 protein E1
MSGSSGAGASPDPEDPYRLLQLEPISARGAGAGAPAPASPVALAQPPSWWWGGAVGWATLRHVALVLAWTLVYYATSAAAGIWNKWLVDSAHAGVAPTTLTLLHLAIGLASDSGIRRCTRDEVRASVLVAEHRRSASDLVAAFLPISVFVILTKVTTYLSYQYVSIALAHTAKASEPIFNVVVAALIFGEFHSRQVYFSLVPISLGIFLASVSDFSYNHTGFFIAVLSALAKVLQNIYTKRLMETGRYTFWEVHMFCGAASLLVMLPVLYLQQVTFETSPFAHLPLFALLLDSVLQWTSSVASYVVLSLVSHLTATVINVMKRLVMIVSGDLFDGNGMAPLNVVGVCLAMVGVMLYNVVRDGDFDMSSFGFSEEGATKAPPPPWILLARAFLEPFRVAALKAWAGAKKVAGVVLSALPLAQQRSVLAAVAYVSLACAVASRRACADEAAVALSGADGGGGERAGTIDGAWAADEDGGTGGSSGAGARRLASRGDAQVHVAPAPSAALEEAGTK